MAVSPHRFATIGKELVRRLGKAVAEHVPIKDLSGLGVGGVADYYLPARSPNALLAAVGAARALELPWVVIGTGSHSLMADFGFAGLVIGNQAQAATFVPGRGQVIAESGVTWPQLLLPAASHGLAGVASLLSLPGTLGANLALALGTPATNPVSIVRHATLLMPDGTVGSRSGRGLMSELSRGAIVLTATLQLIQTRPDQIAAEIGPALRARRQWDTHQRRWLGPVLSIRDTRFPFAIDDLLRQADLSHLRQGNASCSRLRPNYIEIRGRTTARELRALVSRMYEEFSAAAANASVRVHCTFLGNWEE